VVDFSILFFQLGGWFFDFKTQLMSWFIFEQGDEYLWFDGSEPLTIELSKSTIIEKIRFNFYINGGGNISKTLQKYNLQNLLGQLVSKVYSQRNSYLFQHLLVLSSTRSNRCPVDV
jgi:hypothetical protein